MVTRAKNYFFHLIEMFYSCKDPVLFVAVSSHTQYCVEHIVDTQYILVVPLNHGEGEAF